MKNYVIMADSACDLDSATLSSWGVKISKLTFRFNDDNNEYCDGDIDSKQFYDRMRAGGVAKSAAINTESFKEAFENELKEGNDVFYLGFSSGLSTTYNSARIAAEELSSEYPDAKIVVCDSLSASAGFGLLLYYAVNEKKNGTDIDTLKSRMDEMKFRLCHWFTVDDLVYLKRGGRISPTAAFVGNALGIKPVLHMDNEGHLINMAKVRGRKNAISALCDKFGELAIDKSSSAVFISHGDCYDDAKALADMIKTKYGSDTMIITNVGTVIGAHSGPGTLALFFLGSER